MLTHFSNADSNDGIINLRTDRDKDNHEPEFKIGGIEGASCGTVGKVEAVSVNETDETAMKSYDKVKVKFDKFVNLVATHAYEEVFDKHLDDDVIISTDLLTDLANAHEESRDNKMPVILVVGIVIGIALTYLLFKL